MSDSSPKDATTSVLPPTIKVTFDRNGSSSSRKRAISVEKNRRGSAAKSIEEPDESHEDDKKAQEEVVASLRRFEESPSMNFEPAPPVQFQPLTNDLPPANPLINAEKYSMEADMIFGWKPKFIMKAPIPLKFTSSMVEEIVNTLRYSQKNEQFPELVYSGFRPENSFFLHHRFSSPETYIFKLPPTLQSRHAMYWKMMNNSVNPARPFVGMKKEVAADCLAFDAIFEHGNLDVAIRKAKDEYDLFLRVDSNTRGHTCWYYFKVQNMQKGQTVKFNICNLSRTDSLYQRGMKPYVHSKRLSEEKKVGWEQTGENITYRPSHISYLNQHFDEEYSAKRYHKLSFEYTFNYDDDVVSFALCIPYTYSQLLQYIQTLTDDQKPEETCITSSKLCTSLGGVHVPLLTITDPDESEIPLCKRQYVVCSARVHPGETNSSWMMQGFITELCKNNAAAKYLRKKFIFKIVPMLNPDGVIVGNHRTGICGNDLNRQYINPQAVLHPSIVALKDLIRDLGQEKKNSIFAYFDFHGHSLMKNVFMYGAEFPIHTLNYYRIKILPMIISKNTQMFRFRSCTFTIPKCKLATARAVFSMHYGITHCYTIEASYASYLNADKENVPFNQESYMGMGIAVAGGICEYKRLIEEEEIHALTLKFRQEIDDKETIEVGSFDNGSVDADDSRLQGNEGDDKKRQNKFRIKKARPAKIDYLGRINAASCEPVEREKRFKSTGRETSKDRKPKVGLASVFKGHYLNSGIARIIQEIKNDALKKDENEDILSDHASSKGESDTGAAEDDFQGEEFEMVQDNIVYQITEFTNLCNQEKIDMSTYKFGPRKQRPPPEDNTKRVQTLSPDKSASPDKSEGKKSPRKLVLPKYTPRETNWAARLREKVPLMPRQVQMVVEKIIEPNDAQEQMYNFHGGAFSGTKANRKYLSNGYSIPKKILEAKDLTQKTEPPSQLPNLINADIVKIIKLNPTFKEGVPIEQPVAAATKTDNFSSNRMGRTLNTVRKISDISQETASLMKVSPPKSLKALMGLDKPKPKQRPNVREAVSFDQRNDNEISANLFVANLSLSTEQDDDRSFINALEGDKSMDMTVIVPQVTVVQTQVVQTPYVVNGALAKKKDKKLPMSFIAHKKTMRLKQKRRDQSSEASYLI